MRNFIELTCERDARNILGAGDLKQVVLFSSARGSSSNLLGLSLTQSSNSFVILVQDAVLLALKSSNELQNAEGYVLEEHLTKRGFDAASLKERFKLVKMDLIVKLMMDDETHLIGSF